MTSASTKHIMSLNSKQSIILSLLILLFGQCNLSKKNHLGYEEVDIPTLSEKHYYSLMQEKSKSTNWHEAFSIEIQQAKFKTQIFSYSEIIDTEFLQETECCYVFQLKSKTHFIVRESDWDNSVKTESEVQIFDFYAVEFPAISETIPKEKFDTNKHKFQTEVIVEPAKILRKYDNHSKESAIFKAGFYTDLIEFELSSQANTVTWNMIQQIEMKLSQLGYDIKTNGTISKDELAELKKFQIAKGINSESINLETIELLRTQNL